MAAKVLNTVVVAIGVLVLALLAFIAAYLVGYGLFAIFSHSGMGTSTARGVGGAIALVVAIAVLWLFLRGLRARMRATANEHHRRAA